MENVINDLTSKQKDFLFKLKESYGTLALPSYETIKNDLNFKSKNSIKQYIETLKNKSLIFSQNNNLYLKTELFGAKLVFSNVKAGFASIMDDKIEKRISMDEIFDINSPSTFVFKVSGDSMCDIGILDGDYVIIKKTPQANIDDVVLACIDNEFSLKTYKKDKIGYYLKPENKNYPILRPKFSLTIFGVAIGITRRF
jgi:repressor LexA